MTKQRKPHDDGDDILAIDKYQLDEAWVNQGQLYNWYVMRAADARQVMDEAKAKFEVVQANLSLAIRANPEGFGVSKTTEKMIDALVVAQPRYSEALEEVHSKTHDYDCLKGLLIALDHKKKALEKLVELQGRDYFSEPKAPKEDRGRLEEVKRDNISGRGIKKKRRRIRDKEDK